VRKAIDEMASENLLVRTSGQGNVCCDAINDPRCVSSAFLRLAHNQWRSETAMKSRSARVLASAKQGQEVARQPSTSERPGRQIIIVRRLLKLWQGAGCDRRDLPAGRELFPDSESRCAQGTPRAPCTAFLKGDIGVRMVRAEERLARGRRQTAS
jgi:DNA-binding GntR family transcriptional regulator